MTEARKVVGLRGEIPLGTADAEIVTRCRRLLELAESGQMHSLAACYERDDGKITTVLQTNGNHFAMSHAIGALWWRFQARMHADSEADPETKAAE